MLTRFSRRGNWHTQSEEQPSAGLLEDLHSKVVGRSATEIVIHNVVSENNAALLDWHRWPVDKAGMQGVGKRLQERARVLGLSDRMVATRLDMSQQRYANYVRDTTEPDFQTLRRICEVLLTTPDHVLGFSAGVETADEASVLFQRIRAAVSVMDLERLRLTANVVDVLSISFEAPTRGFEADRN